MPEFVYPNDTKPKYGNCEKAMKHLPDSSCLLYVGVIKHPQYGESDAYYLFKGSYMGYILLNNDDLAVTYATSPYFVEGVLDYPYFGISNSDEECDVQVFIKEILKRAVRHKVLNPHDIVSKIFEDNKLPNCTIREFLGIKDDWPSVLLLFNNIMFKSAINLNR